MRSQALELLSPSYDAKTSIVTRLGSPFDAAKYIVMFVEGKQE